MKLKTSFFDFTVLKKDLTRFAPIWALYLIGGLLITQVFATQGPRNVAEELGVSLSSMGIINLCYAALIAICLFGDLFKAKMCNALHALPVRREAWFVTHITAAILMCLVPNLVLALFMLPGAAQFWYVPLLWLGVVVLQFLFFFGVAVFSIYLTGNGFATALVYGLINFCSILVMWVVDAFYTPLLYGLKTQTEAFTRFSPTVYFFEKDQLWDVEHSANCTFAHHNYNLDYDYNASCQYELVHESGAWVYLAIVAAIGVALLAASLLLYRRRRLESAGDFAAVRPMKTVFTLVGSVAAGMLFSVFNGGDEIMGYILVFLGGLVGFFVCQMLLARTIKVFGLKNWGKLGALVAAIALSIGLTAVDAFGITRIVPDADEVASVTLADSHLSDYRIEQLNDEFAASNKARGVDPSYLYGRNGYLTLTDPAQIQEAIAIHELLLAEGAPDDGYRSNRTAVTIHYQLKNGTTLTRYYYGYDKGEAIKRLKNFTNTPAYILGVNSVEELLEGLEYAYYSDDSFYYEIEDPIWLQKLAEALYADAEAGNLPQNNYSSGKGYVEFQCRAEDGRYNYLSIGVPTVAKNTRQWAEEYYAYLKENDLLYE